MAAKLRENLRRRKAQSRASSQEPAREMNESPRSDLSKPDGDD